MIRYFLFTGIFLLFFYQPVLSQMQVMINTSTGYETNAYANTYGDADMTSRLSAMIQKGWYHKSGGIELFYSGSLYHYKNTTERTNQYHALTLDTYYGIDPLETRINMGGKLSGSWFSETYNWYNRNTVSAYLHAKSILTPQLYGYFGFEIYRLRFQDLDVFSHTRLNTYLRLSRFLDSGTSLISEINFYQKSMKPESQIALPAEIPQIIALGGSHSQQVVGLVRIAQSITRSIGLSTQALIRRNLTNSVRFLQSTTGAYYSDEMLFDDIFGYESNEWLLSLKTRVSKGFKTQASVSFIRKNYSVRKALTLEGVEFDDERLRSDDRLTLWLSFEKSFGSLFNVPLSWSLTYIYLNNVSNDPYYDYNNHSLNMGFSTRF